MTIIEFKFDIFQQIWIKDLQYHGIILSYWHIRNLNKYEIRYCTDGEYKTEYLFEFELLESKP